MPLTPEFKTNTIVALRGKKYKQHRFGVGDFKSKRLCCIGVAADVNGIVASTLTLTEEASEFIGLTDEERQEWIEWNDVNNLSFDEIADKIEAKY